MKLFMKSHYEKKAREMKPPLEYEAICVPCAGKLGGKVVRWLKMQWKFDTCSACGYKREVTSREEYMWR